VISLPNLTIDVTGVDSNPQHFWSSISDLLGPGSTTIEIKVV